MKKRLCGLLLAIAILLPILPTVGAEDSYSLLYRKLSNGLQVTQIEITGYEGTLPEKLVIPEQIEGIPVRYISNRAFKNAPIRELVLPGTIENLNTTTFAENETLEAVTVGEGTKVISQAFSYCVNLKSVTLPSTIQELGNEAFCCTAIENIQLPKELKIIRRNCFELRPRFWYNRGNGGVLYGAMEKRCTKRNNHGGFRCTCAERSLAAKDRKGHGL